jgi:O2-independent ubiquinone biosynthesis accessory factor UbiT
MSQSQNATLSPYLFLGLILRPLFNSRLMQPCLNALTKRVLKKHPKIIERLSEQEPAKLIISPLDFPCAFLFDLNAPDIKISILKKTDQVEYDAKVQGSYVDLLDMLEGRIDGDALFFSRKLSIDGSTEMVVALRNIMEAESVNLKEMILSLSGPFKLPCSLLMRLHETAMSQAQKDLELIQTASVKTLDMKLRTQANEMKAMKEKMNQFKTDLTKAEDKLSALRRKVANNRIVTDEKTA